LRNRQHPASGDGVKSLRGSRFVRLWCRALATSRLDLANVGYRLPEDDLLDVRLIRNAKNSCRVLHRRELLRSPAEIDARFSDVALGELGHRSHPLVELGI